jgi:hypothetical protein
MVPESKVRRLDVPEPRWNHLCRGHYFLKTFTDASSWPILIPILPQTGTKPATSSPLARLLLVSILLLTIQEDHFGAGAEAYDVAR